MKVTDIIWDEGFKRSYKKKIKYNKDLKEKFWSAIETFGREPFNPKLRTHKLSGRLSGLWAFSVDYDCRVIFEFLDNDEVLLIHIGSHDEIY